MVGTHLPLEKRVKLSGINWDTYQSIKAEPENRNLRLTYHRGVLEIMAPSVRGKKRIDLNRDPAPDLVVEIDITSRSRHREQVYAALQIPEVWRYDGQSLTLLSLSNEGYGAIAQSLIFPKLEAKAIELF